MRRAVLAGLFLFAFGASVSPLARAEGDRSLKIESFDAEILVLPSGDVEVVETIRPRFAGKWNGIYRTIPVDYRTPRGFDYRLRLTVEDVKDGEGKPLRYESSRERHYRKLKIFIPDAIDGIRPVTLRYRVANALRFFEDHDELYWNVTGDEWEVPIESATATVALPAGAKGLRAAAYSGVFGSREAGADVQVEASEVRFHMRRPLAFHEGLTVVVGWDKGVVHEPGWIERGLEFLRSNWPLALPIAVFAAMFRLWWIRGRDPRLHPIAARYEPPDSLAPAEVGTLVDNRVDIRDVTATIVDLAVRGLLRIEETEKPALLGLWSSKDYVFRLLKKKDEWGDLKPHEKALLEALFSGQLYGTLAVVSLSDLQNKFYRDLPDIRRRLFDQLVERGYYRTRPDNVRTMYLVIAGVLLVAGLALSAPLAMFLGAATVTVIVAVVASAAIVAGFGWFMPARTAAGARALEGVLGFEEFLSRVEADRLDRTMRTPATFEKCLPYAMALGVEANWVKAFEDIVRQPPDWYRGTSMTDFRPTRFAGELRGMSVAAASAMTSAPRSSGGSGFGGGGGGGGGSSGGGFGGGGGGGF